MPSGQDQQSPSAGANNAANELEQRPSDAASNSLLQKVETRLARFGKIIKNGKTVALFTLGILGVIVYAVWELKGREHAERFVATTLQSNPDIARKVVLDALLEIDALDVTSRKQQIANGNVSREVDVVEFSLAELAATKVNQLEKEISALEEKIDGHANQFSSTIDSWQTFEFYRYYPSKKEVVSAGEVSSSGVILDEDIVNWVPDTERPVVSKLTHDIIATPYDNLRLYFFPDTESAGGLRRVERKAMLGLKIAGKTFKFPDVKYFGNNIPLHCYTRTSSTSANDHQGAILGASSPSSPRLVRLEIILEEAKRNVEFRYKVYVVSTKQARSEDECQEIQ